MLINFRIVLAGLCLFTLAFSSCKKDDDDTSNNQNNNTADYFIEGKVDGTLVRAETTGQFPGSEFQDNAFHASIDRITFHRALPLPSLIGWQFDIADIDLDTLSIPTTIGLTNSGAPYIIAIYYPNPDNRDESFSESNVFANGENFYITFTGKANDVLEGTFQGKLSYYVDADSFINVTEGKFKVKMVRVP